MTLMSSPNCKTAVWKRNNPERLLPIGSPTSDSNLVIQDVLSIKSYLHKLKKVLENDPLEKSEFVQSNDNNNSNQEEELNELRRQIEILKRQNSEKDSTIAQLKTQMNVAKFPSEPKVFQKLEISTQTEKSSSFCPSCASSTHSPMSIASDGSSRSSNLSSSSRGSSNSNTSRKIRRSQGPLIPMRRPVIKSGEDGKLTIAIRNNDQNVSYTPRITANF